jgi:hypothetical protein
MTSLATRLARGGLLARLVMAWTCASHYFLLPAALPARPGEGQTAAAAYPW